ncbi:hypothetical protein Tco_0004554 [Tanacetum coccineum]
MTCAFMMTPRYISSGLVQNSVSPTPYVPTSSRPALVQAVCYCARYQARPTQKHLKEVKRIFKYLKGIINMRLWCSKDSGFELTTFSDADHAGCLDTRKSTFGGIQFLGDKLVSWMSKKQNCTAMSLAEAEYEHSLQDVLKVMFGVRLQVFLMAKLQEEGIESTQERIDGSGGS